MTETDTETDTDTDMDITSLALPLATREDTRSLLQALDNLQTIKHWVPQEGDTLAGVLQGIKPATGPYGLGHMLIVGTEDGRKHSLWLTAYLKSQLEGFKARPGDMVGIRYLGKGMGARGNAYNRYEVVVQKAAALESRGEHGRN